MCTRKDSDEALEVDKKSVDVDSQLVDMDNIPLRTIVKVLLNGNSNKDCIVTKRYTIGNGSQE